MTKTSMEQHVVNEVIKTNSFSSSTFLAALNKLVALKPKTNLCHLHQMQYIFLCLSKHIPNLFQLLILTFCVHLLRNPALGKALRRGS